MNEEEIKQGLKIINEKYKCRIELDEIENSGNIFLHAYEIRTHAFVDIGNFLGKYGLYLDNIRAYCNEDLTDGVVSLEYTNDDTVFKAVIDEAVKNLKDKFNGGSNE